MNGVTTVKDPWILLLQGNTLGDYLLHDCIGAGNFGLVFEASHVATGGLFAIKVLKPGVVAESVVDFDNEAVLLQQLGSCDGVIKFVDSGVEQISMQAAQGITVPISVSFLVLSRASGSVDELILDPAVRANLSWIERLQIWRDVIKAVRQMHGQGVAHRDLKASNCLLMVRGNLTVAKLGDLGRAKDFTLSSTRPIDDYLNGRGDLRFAPPEYLHLQGESTPAAFIAADYYGLGSVLVELATGQSMTSLALGDLHALLIQSQQDFLAGRRRDISVLKSRYRSVIADIVTELPACVRAEAKLLLAQLCHPVSRERTASSPFKRDRRDRDDLHWILKRVDIMIRQLEIAARTERRANNRMKVPA